MLIDGHGRLARRGFVGGCDARRAGRSLGALCSITTPTAAAATAARAALASLLGAIAWRSGMHRFADRPGACRYVGGFQHISRFGAC